jgi:acetate kinase
VSDATVLSVNAGSSSLKVAQFAFNDDEPRVLHRFETSVHDGNHRAALAQILDALTATEAEPATAVGHRVVHGGPALFDPVLIDRAVLDELRRRLAFAPVHLPAALAGMDLVAERYPRLPQVACFDTAFHRTLPEVARRFPLPSKLWDDGVVRYGFHGLSYEFVVRSLGPDLGARTVVAHLGNGASAVALRDGISIDTTMGFTPTGGLVMGTRSGDLDPGLVVYLLREPGYQADALEDLVDHQGGLKALSGGTSDMKALLEMRDHDPRARLAVDVFCDRVRKAIGAYAVTLGGLDTLVFTGGIGEHAVPVRAQVCTGLGVLGVELDQARNAAGNPIISRTSSPCSVRVVRTDEDSVIARYVQHIVGDPSA